jgi:hypothetical protein
MAAGVGIVVILIVGATLFLSLSPVIEVRFTIQTTLDHVEANALDATYSKVNLIKGFSFSNGAMILTSRATTGSYAMTVELRYGDPNQTRWPNPILSQRYSGVGDGSYVVEVGFVYRQEAASVPYIITVKIAGEGIQPAEADFVVYPTEASLFYLPILGVLLVWYLKSVLFTKGSFDRVTGFAF